MKDDIPVEENLCNLKLDQFTLKDGKIETNQGVIKDCYVCIRPANLKNVPKIKAKFHKKRIVSDNYGHGGSGWSLVWGSVIKSIEFVESLLEDKSDLKNHKIAILGSGVMGCATILKLIDKGVEPQNIQIFTKQMGDTTSHRSGAFLSTASILDKIDPDLEKLYVDININTYKDWDNIEKGHQYPKLKNGVLKIKSYFGAEKETGTIETESGLDIFVENGLIPEPKLVKVKFNNRYNLMRKYDSFYFNTYRLMNSFYDYILQDYKIKINFREIKDYDEIENDFNIIFNCTGIANQNMDDDIYPLAGHVITLKDQDINKFNYVLYTHYIYEEDKGKYSYNDAPLFYFMPKTDDISFTGLLGGSFVKNYSGGNSELDNKEYLGIMRRTLEIYGHNSDMLVPKI